MAKRTKVPAFEEALAELEQVVDRLERGELPLEESLAAFERGMGLVRSLTERLAEIEQRVEVLLDAHGPGAAAPAGGDDLAVRDDDD